MKPHAPISIKPADEKKTVSQPFVTPSIPKVDREPPRTVEPEKSKPVFDSVPIKEFEQTGKTNTDIEKFIGENLANKIGIAVLVLGIAFFIKYAIDKNWINEVGRVIIGLISGGILMGFAHRFRNSYRSFSSVLVGGGLSVFYFSVAFAFHQYGLIGQTTAFIFMVIISGLGVVLSLFYNRQELAILATIGAFITPFLVSTGKENHEALFTYLCIINAGLMVLSWFKRWPAINTIALFFTTIIYGGWLIKRTIFENPDNLPSGDALLFGTLFYVLFVAMNIINTIRLKSKFTAFDFIIVLSINFLYYAVGMIILNYWIIGNYKGLFTGLLGIFNLSLAFIFYRKKSIDRNFVLLLIGLSLTFISLIAPVQFKGDHVVLFWAAESVILLWLFQRSQIGLLRYASLALVLLTLLSLLNAWTQTYFQGTGFLPIVFNKGFITTITTSIALFIYHALLRKESKPTFAGAIPGQPIKRAVLIIAIIIAYLAAVWEIWYQFGNRYADAPLYATYLQAYTFAVAILLLWLFRKDSRLPLLKFLFTAICFALYLFNSNVNHEVSMSLLRAGKGFLFIAHWIAALLLLWLLYDLILFFFKKTNRNWFTYSTSFTWIAAAGIIVVLSVEMYHVILWTNYRDPADWIWRENLYYKAGLSILWGLCSFTMMWLGMKKDFKPLRIISLTLFTLTLLKLFAYDIRNIPPGGKIAAFILLGVLLLAISFMYQRLKKIIIENKTLDKIIDNN